MAKPGFVPFEDAPRGPPFELPDDLPLEFAGKPEDVGPPEHAGGPVGLDLPFDSTPPVDLSGVPPIEAPFEATPVDPPLFTTSPVAHPDFDLS